MLPKQINREGIPFQQMVIEPLDIHTYFIRNKKINKSKWIIGLNTKFKITELLENTEKHFLKKFG